MKFRVTYCAVKHENLYRPQVIHGETTGNIELLDSRVSFREEKTVEVDSLDEASAIKLATAKLPAGCDIAAQATLVRPRGPSA